MTRSQLLQHLLHQARTNGFELRKWFRTEAALPWPGGDEAILWLGAGNRAHLLLFSHTFVKTFFGGPNRVRFIQPAATFQRTLPDGSQKEIHRRAHTRTTAAEEVWRYHLREMVVAPEPLRYIRRFLILEEILQEGAKPAPPPTLPPEPTEPDYDDELLVREEDAPPQVPMPSPRR